MCVLYYCTLLYDDQQCPCLIPRCRANLPTQVVTPGYLSADSAGLLRGLLDKDVSRRLGCVKSTRFTIGGVAALKQHPFFADFGIGIVCVCVFIVHVLCMSCTCTCLVTCVSRGIACLFLLSPPRGHDLSCAITDPVFDPAYMLLSPPLPHVVHPYRLGCP